MPAVVGVLAVEGDGSPRNLLSLSTTITFEVADLPEDVVALVDAHLLDLGGTYGDPRRATPSSTTSDASRTTRASW